MNLEDRIEALTMLGDYIRSDSVELNEAKQNAYLHNKWFTPKNINFALTAWGNDLLKSEILSDWVSNYNFKKKTPLIVGLILAGNIPLVGFHDIISTFISGHKALIKTSRKDAYLTVHLIEKLQEFSGHSDLFEVSESLKGMDAIIATGSNYSASQFEKYFSKYPNIIRRNRNAVGILKGDETKEELLELAKDIFTYFGLGCRNISKLYVPKSYDFYGFMEALHDEYKDLVNHTKYKNNYDYNYALYLLNGEKFLASGSIIVRPNNDITSRIACLHYEEYSDLSFLNNQLQDQLDEIQCISSKMELKDLQTIPLGFCQRPNIDDYADGVDTLQFLSTLNR